THWPRWLNTTSPGTARRLPTAWLEHSAIDVADTGAAEQRHRRADLVAEDLEHPVDTGRAAHGEPVAGGPAHEDNAGAQSEGLRDVPAAADTAVHRHLGVATDLVDDLGKLVERRRGAVELATAVVRHVDGRRTGVDGGACVLGGEHALHGERQ